MKKLVFISLLLVSAAVSSAQTTNPLCPKATVIGPPGVTNAGDVMEFNAKIDSRSTNLSYIWTVSHGSIEVGQNTNRIVVRTSIADASQNVVATVVVAGAQSGCELVASESGPVAGVLPSCPLDEWGKLKPNDVRGRLDNLFQELSDYPTNSAVIILFLAEKEEPDKKNARLQFIVKHAKFRKIDLDLLIFKLKPSDESSTRIYRAPPGAELPCPECLMISGRELK